MRHFNYRFQLPDETGIELAEFLEGKGKVRFVFDFSNTTITAKEFGHEPDYEGIAEKFPNIEKDVFITQRDFIRYGRKLKGYQVHASPGKNCDIEIALHLNSLKHSSKVKLVCFFCGDGDFHPVLLRLKDRGIVIKCLSFESSFSPRLLDVAEFVPIGYDFLKPSSQKETKRYA